MTSLSGYREEFPVVGERTYLISASLGPLSRRARRAAEEHLDLWSRLGPEELWFEHALPKLDACRERLATMIGAHPHEVAVVPSVSAGLSSIATCLSWDERPGVVLTDMDFPTNHYVWRAQERVGARLDVVASPDGITVPTHTITDAIGAATQIVNVNRVLFESSYIQDVEAITAAAHDAGALVVVDDFHGTGIVPIDVHELGIDFLLTGVLKWVCGGQGIAFLYCREDLIQRMDPLVVGWFGTKDPFDFRRDRLVLRDDARRFEAGTYTLPQAWTAAAASELILEVGVEVIRAHNQKLTQEIVSSAEGLGLELLSPKDATDRGGLVRVRVPGGRAAAEDILHKLFEADVVLDQRGDALRISPHFFNTESDIDRAFEELARLL